MNEPTGKAVRRILSCPLSGRAQARYTRDGVARLWRQACRGSLREWSCAASSRRGLEETAAIVDFALAHPEARLADRRIMLEAARRSEIYMDPSSDLKTCLID